MKTIKITFYGEISTNFTGIVEYYSGDKYWYKEGKCHRLDGPAVEYVNGYKAWHKEGKRHRLDGPAIEYPNGDKFWYVDNIKYIEEDYHQAVLDYKLKMVLES